MENTRLEINDENKLLIKRTKIDPNLCHLEKCNFQAVGRRDKQENVKSIDGKDSCVVPLPEKRTQFTVSVTDQTESSIQLIFNSSRTELISILILLTN